ncbi:hypothetical protein DFX87_23430 [Escherichia coli]|nr:hypothetical protein [Escherichia coli]
MGCSFTLDSQCGRLWLYQPPATGTHTGVWHPAGNEQGPAATTKSACAKRRCPLHPGVFCRDAGSAGHGATEAARQRRRDRNGRCKPGFRVRDGSPPGRRQLRWLRSRQPAPPGGRPGKP